MPYKDPAKRNARQRAQHAADPERQRAYVRADAAAHPEKRRIRTKAHRARHLAQCRERDRATAARERLLHPERNRVRQAKHRATHKEDINARARARQAEHPEETRAKGARRRALKAHAPINDFTAQQWRDMQTAYDHRCVYCGKRAKGHLTQDHLTPLSKGGNHTLSNILPACNSCNSRKRDRAVLVPVQPLLL